MTPVARRWLFALVVCMVVVVVCVTELDRPIAVHADNAWRGTTIFALAVDFLRAVQLLLAVAIALVLGSTVWHVLGRQLPSQLQVAARGAWGMIAALLLSLILKFAFGRSQVVPPYLTHHIYQFRLLHGGQDYAAFPSATMAVAAAMLAVLWIHASRLRAIYVAAGLLLGTSLVVTNGHWVGDIIAGAFLGVSVGWLAAETRRLPGLNARAYTRPSNDHADSPG